VHHHHRHRRHHRQHRQHLHHRHHHRHLLHQRRDVVETDVRAPMIANPPCSVARAIKCAWTAALNRQRAPIAIRARRHRLHRLRLQRQLLHLHQVHSHVASRQGRNLIVGHGKTKKGTTLIGLGNLVEHLPAARGQAALKKEVNTFSSRLLVLEEAEIRPNWAPTKRSLSKQALSWNLIITCTVEVWVPCRFLPTVMLCSTSRETKGTSGWP
jgi:hypothetical protein